MQRPIQNPKKKASSLSLYLVTDPVMCQTRGWSLIDTVCDAIEGGVTMVQLRDKFASDDDIYNIACKLKEAIAGKVPLVIDDRVHIAKKAKLDGVHLGQTDMDVLEARKILGQDAWIGLTLNQIAQIDIAFKHYGNKVDYFGIGPVYPTATKNTKTHQIGIDTLSKLVNHSYRPTVAIGGININNAADVYRTGCDGIAVVSAICNADNPKIAAQSLTACQTK